MTPVLLASSTREVISSASAIWSISISKPRRRAIRSPIPIEESASAGMKIGIFSCAQTDVSDSVSGFSVQSHSPSCRINSREEPRNGAMDVGPCCYAPVNRPEILFIGKNIVDPVDSPPVQLRVVYPVMCQDNAGSRGARRCHGRYSLLSTRSRPHSGVLPSP